MNESNLRKLELLGFEKSSLTAENRDSLNDTENPEEHVVYNYHLERLLDQYIQISHL